MRKGVKPLVFREESHMIEVRYANRGEPYRDGVEITFANDDQRQPATWVLLDSHEVRLLRDKLTEYLGEAAATIAEPPVELAVFGQYDHLEAETPVFSWIGLDVVCNVAAQANYGAVRLATALVRAIEARDAVAARPPSNLASGLRKLIKQGVY